MGHEIRVVGRDPSGECSMCRRVGKRLRMRKVRGGLKKAKLPSLLYMRKLRGMSQKELAMKAGLSQQAISLIEVKERSTYPETRERLARALGVDERQLMWAPDKGGPKI